MTILQQEVQDVPLSFFQKLEAGDVLFIDSSHVVRLDGDVIYLYLEVLPALAAGVLIHIHDIAFPYLMPDPERWVFGSKQFWTEAAFVAAVLQNNSNFSILLCTSYLHFRYPDELKVSSSSMTKRSTSLPLCGWESISPRACRNRIDKLLHVTRTRLERYWLNRPI
jgi:hypothetical protein